MTPESSSVAMKFQQLISGETVTPGGYRWLEMEEGVIGNKIKVVAWQNSSRIKDNGDGFSGMVSQAGNGGDLVSLQRQW